MMPYPDDWELDHNFFTAGAVQMSIAQPNRNVDITLPEVVYECNKCAALVFDRKAHYIWHYPVHGDKLK